MSERVYNVPKKSPYSCELYDSDFERQFMDELEKDPKVKKWTKNHSIRIPYVDIESKVLITILISLWSMQMEFRSE